MRKRSTYGETERIRVEELKESPVDEIEDEVTKPHDLPVLNGGDLDAPATGHDVLVLWNRMDKHSRSRRETGGRMKSMAFKMRIIWYIGGVLVAGILASLGATGKFLYSRGGQETESAITLKTTVDKVDEQGRRLRIIEDTMIRLVQMLEDAPGRGRDRDRSRPDGTTGSTPRGKQ